MYIFQRFYFSLTLCYPLVCVADPAARSIDTSAVASFLASAAPSPHAYPRTHPRAIRRFLKGPAVRDLQPSTAVSPTYTIPGRPAATSSSAHCYPTFNLAYSPASFGSNNNFVQVEQGSDGHYALAPPKNGVAGTIFTLDDTAGGHLYYNTNNVANINPSDKVSLLRFDPVSTITGTTSTAVNCTLSSSTNGATLSCVAGAKAKFGYNLAATSKVNLYDPASVGGSVLGIKLIAGSVGCSNTKPPSIPVSSSTTSSATPTPTTASAATVPANIGNIGVATGDSIPDIDADMLPDMVDLCSMMCSPSALVFPNPAATASSTGSGNAVTTGSGKAFTVAH